MTIETSVRAILRDVLGISQERADALRPETGLFGDMPELDSMAVAGLLAEMEDRLGIMIDDDDVDLDMMSSFGGLVRFAENKAGQ